MPKNAPHDALTRAINLAIAAGAPVYENKPAQTVVTLSREEIETLLDKRELCVRINSGRVWDSLRRNGATKLWKTRPAEFRIPIKYGFRGTGYIDQNTEIVRLADGRLAI